MIVLSEEVTKNYWSESTFPASAPVIIESDSTFLADALGITESGGTFLAGAPGTICTILCKFFVVIYCLIIYQ